MSRFYGEVGFATSVEVRPGYYKEVMQEVKYFGDIVSDSRTFESSDQVNPDLTLGETVKIVADDNLLGHFTNIRYVKWNGTNWIVNSARVVHPRLHLQLGGVYNGETPPAA